MNGRFVEALCGVLAGVWGLLVEGYLLFGPFYASTGSSGSGHSGLIESGIETRTIVSLSVLALLLVSVSILSLVDSQQRNASVRVWLIIATVLLVLDACAAIASIGFLLIPSLVLAIVAVILSTLREQTGPQRQATS